MNGQMEMSTTMGDAHLADVDPHWSRLQNETAGPFIRSAQAPVEINFIGPKCGPRSLV